MTTKDKPPSSGRIRLPVGAFLFLFCCIQVNKIDAQEARQLTSGEFNTELKQALLRNDEEEVLSLIRDHRLFVKPFVDGLIKESISRELKGRLAESGQLSSIAVKTAGIFKDVFGEKSLQFAVNYLTTWNKEQKERKLVADSLYAMGIRMRGSEPKKSLEYHLKALDLYKEIGDERGEGEILGGLGLHHARLNNDTSLMYYRSALVIREKVDDKVLTGNTLNSLGSLYYGIYQDYPAALDCFDKAEKIRRELGDSVNLGRTIHLKASVLENLGRNEQALEYYKRSLSLNQSSGDQVRVAESLLNSGTILNDLGKYTDAIEFLGKAEKTYLVLEDSIGISDSYNQLGFVYLNLGDLNAALERFNEAIRITRKLNDKWGLAGIYNNMGIMLQNAGRYEKALEYATDALQIYEELKDQSSIIVSLNNIGTILYDMKNYPEAEKNYLKGLKICRELNIRDQEANYLLNLANARGLMGRMDDALLNYQEGFAIARTLGSPDLTWKYVAGLAEYYETIGKYEKVIELNDTALKILEGLRSTLPGDEFKATFMAKERYVFEDIIDLLETLHEKDRTKGYDKLAFRYAEQSKSRVLLDLLSEAKLTPEYDSDKVHLPDQELLSIDEAKALCPDRNTTVLEYSVGDSSSCLWVITHSDLRIFKLPRRKILQEQIETIRFSLTDPQQTNSDFFTNSGRILYEELIQPAEPFLTKKSKLIIIPDGVLNYLPFEVLLTEYRKPTNGILFSDMPFLVKKYPVSYAQSASVLSTLIRQRSKSKEPATENKKLLAFGYPVYEDTSLYPRQEFQELEFSGREIENIASFFREGTPVIYLRDNANEENLKQNNELDNFSFIHFAVHGLINEDKPDLSSLVLSRKRTSGEDGLLHAAEVFKLKLNPELVVLSACQTGLGKLVRGEGIVGLTRAFMYAGAPSVLVSLWSVSDLSTADLMGEFYRNLIKNQLSKTDALRQAQLSLIRDPKYAHPFYWAPFILIGDWR